MRRRCLFTLAACLFAGAANALPLWELEGTRNEIRLLGSIHLLRPTDYPLSRAIDQAYEDAEVIVMEADLSQQDPLQMQTIVQALAVDPRGRGLSDLISAGAYRKVATTAASFSIDVQMLEPYEPWFAALQITQLRMFQLGFDMSYGVDMHFTQRAQRDQKKIIGLETIEQQLKLMDSLPSRAQQSFLLQTVEEAETIDEGIDSIVDAWRQGDERRLQKEMLQGMQDQPALYQRIIVARNRDWTASIKRYANDSEDYLIVVGTLHLVGPDSVLSMLEDAGYPARQIRR